MQTVILAAGKGIRVQPLSLTRPKPLLGFLGKSVLEHNLDQLVGLVKEVILVVGYKGEKIKEFFGRKYKNLKITYVFQKKQIGTGDAAKKALPYIKDKFLLLNGDDFYEKADIKNCLKKLPSILVKKVKNSSSFGQILIKKNIVKGLVEKPKKPVSKMVNTGLYFLDKSVFNFKIKKSERGEYEFTDYLKAFMKKRKLYWKLAKDWFPVPCLWNLLDVNEYLLGKIRKSLKKGKIEKNCRLSGKVIIEKGTLIKSGSYIAGPVYIGKNSIIGPNCFIRGSTSIGENCRIGQAVEIKNSIIGDNSKICHLSYVGDSIIGSNCNLGAGTIVANLRHDKKTVKTMINGKLKDTGRKNFGTILGDNVKTGIGTLIYPGRKIWPGKFTLPGQIVKKDII
jgi:bifunctional UDP-N-acetylglucosamine pyrophosphorylase/glucosamine-1-phosphate N-acetyltransferase